MSTRITIVMGVRDEVELLEYNIEHHLKLGVNKIYLVDNKSSDGSTEILKKYVNHPKCEVFFSSHNGNTNNMQRLRLLAFGDPETDYLLHIDPDEFLVIQDGYSLESLLTDNPSDCYYIKRYNTVPVKQFNTPSNKLFENLHKFFFYTMPYSPKNNDIVLPSIASLFYNPTPQKSLHRAVDCMIDFGGHAVFSPHIKNILYPSKIFIAHLPITTLNRFRKRSSNLARQVQNHPKYHKTNVPHWWFISEGYQSGQVEEMFDSCIHSPDELKDFLRSNLITQGTTLLKQPDQMRKPNVLNLQLSCVINTRMYDDLRILDEKSIIQ